MHGRQHIQRISAYRLDGGATNCLRWQIDVKCRLDFQGNGGCILSSLFDNLIRIILRLSTVLAIKIANLKAQWLGIITLVLFCLVVFNAIFPSETSNKFIAVASFITILLLAIRIFKDLIEKPLYRRYIITMSRAKIYLFMISIVLRNHDIRHNAYAIMMKSSAFSSFWAVLTLSVVASVGFLRNEWEPVWCSIAGISFILLFRSLSYWRIRNQYFGNEAEEVLEFISFLSKRKNDDPLPPGATLSSQGEREAQPRSISTDLVGAKT